MSANRRKFGMYAPKRRRRKYIGAAASADKNDVVEPYAVAVSKRSEVRESAQEPQ